MGTKFTYALILTISQAVFSLLMYFGGFQTEKLATGQYLNWIGLVISIVVFYLGIKAVREERPQKDLSYGQGVGAGFVISVLSSLMSAVYTFIHFKFINPAFFDYQAEFMKQKWAAKGMTDAQIETASTMMQKFSGPGITAFFVVIVGIVIGVVISLILAAILKRETPAGATPTAA